jgi:hypothetical protein
MYAKNGAERCSCPSGTTGCSGDGCVMGRNHNDAAEVLARWGFAAECTTCKCIGGESSSSSSGAVAKQQAVNTNNPSSDGGSNIQQSVRAGGGGGASRGDLGGATGSAAFAAARMPLPPDVPPSPLSLAELKARRACTQQAFRTAFGFDYNEAYYVMGCNVSAIPMAPLLNVR